MLSLFIIVSLVNLALVTIFLLQRLYARRAKDLEERNKRLSALRKLDEIMLSSTTDLIELCQKVTDAISFELGFEIGVLALIDEQKGVLKRVAMSRTETGNQAKKSLPIRYENLDIPLTASQNIAIKAIATTKPQTTHDLYDVFVPALDRETSQKIQETVKVKTSFVHPIRARGKAIGVMIISIGRLESQMSAYEKESIGNLVDFVGIALENAMLYQSLKEARDALTNVNTQVTRMNRQLQDLDKLKDDFVSIASHELRTPMTAIRSYSWMAINRSDMELTPRMKKYLNRILTSTERLINLVNDMLNISRIESGRIEILPKPFDLHTLISDVFAEVEPKTKEKNIHLSTVGTPLPKVFADVDKVHQILLNLIGNALKFTPVGGTISLSFFISNTSVEISVKDSGVGISSEDKSRLFQKFGRLDNSYVAAATSGGTGLGLYICKSLVELMGGKIWVYSEGLGKGTTFSFSLPIASKLILANADKYTSHVSPKEARTLEPVAI